MADKPRSRRLRSARRKSDAADGGDKRRLLIIAGAVALLVVGRRRLLPARRRRRHTSADDARAALEAAGCTLRGQAGGAERRTTPTSGSRTARAKWNTDPPTSGPHYGVTADLRRVHGATAARRARAQPRARRRLHPVRGRRAGGHGRRSSRAFYDEHENGTILAPYPKLGDKIALGAWYADGLPRHRAIAEAASSRSARRSTRTRSPRSSTRSSSRARRARSSGLRPWRRARTSRRLPPSYTGRPGWRNG